MEERKLEELTSYQQAVLVYNGIQPEDWRMLAKTDYAWHLQNIKTGNGVTLYWRPSEND